MKTRSRRNGIWIVGHFCLSLWAFSWGCTGTMQTSVVELQCHGLLWSIQDFCCFPWKPDYFSFVCTPLAIKKKTVTAEKFIWGASTLFDHEISTFGWTKTWPAALAIRVPGARVASKSISHGLPWSNSACAFTCTSMNFSAVTNFFGQGSSLEENWYEAWLQINFECDQVFY